MDRVPSVEELLGENAQLREVVIAQAGEIAILTAKVAVLEKQNSRDSSNSSKGPAGDGVVPRQKRAARRAEQRQEGRKPGKQKGGQGVTLGRREPDETVTHTVSCCSGCGSDMAEAVVVGTEVRQVIDVLPAQLKVTDHVAETRRCACGKVSAGVFPAAARGPVCWGPETRALAAHRVAAKRSGRDRGPESRTAASFIPPAT